MITREADYAIRTVLYLAQKEGEGNISSAELAEEMFVPYSFLRRIVQKLVEEGIVESRRGKGGGVLLLKKKGEISLFDVLQSFDPKALQLNSCFEDESFCPRSGICSVHKKMDGVQKLLNNNLRDITFDQLCDQ